MPFGARASSFHMQTVANCITDILKAKGIDCMMYLDDLIILSPNREDAWAHYNAARDLIAELGLPEAVEKAQPLTQRVKWLGIPPGKVANVVAQVDVYNHKQWINKKQLQSLLGHLLFVAKCVRPARTFVSRILEALRGATGNSIRNDTGFRSDLAWFREFCSQWNGVGIIPQATPSRTILVDACLSGVGATDGGRSYGQQLAPAEEGAANITELEAINVVFALHTFLTPLDRGTHIRIRCDNLAAVMALCTGRAGNHILQECARASWMVQAVLGVHISFDHIPGKDNEVADALSRAHLGGSDHDRASSLVAQYDLQLQTPCMFFLNSNHILLRSRSGAVITTSQGLGKAGEGPRTGDGGKPHIGHGHVHCIHGTVPGGPPVPDASNDMRFPGVHSAPHAGASNHPQQALPCEDLLAPRGGHRDGAGAPQGKDGPRGDPQGQDIYTPYKTATPSDRNAEGLGISSRLGGRASCQSSSPAHVLWGATPVGGGAPYDEQIRQVSPPHASRSGIHSITGNTTSKMGKEPSKEWPNQNGHPPGDFALRHVPSGGGTYEHSSRPYTLPSGPPANVPRHSAPHPGVIYKEDMGRCPQTSRGRPHTVFFAQSQKDSCHTGTPSGMQRNRDTEARGMAFKCLQNIYRHPHWEGHRSPGGSRY